MKGLCISAVGWRCELCVCASVTVVLHAAEVFHTAGLVALTQIPVRPWESEQSRLSNRCSLPSPRPRQMAHVRRTALQRRMKTHSWSHSTPCVAVPRLPWSFASHWSQSSFTGLMWPLTSHSSSLWIWDCNQQFYHHWLNSQLIQELQGFSWLWMGDYMRKQDLSPCAVFSIILHI